MENVLYPEEILMATMHAGPTCVYWSDHGNLPCCTHESCYTIEEDQYDLCCSQDGLCSYT